jgi:ribose 5-phosphate isomerase B
MTSVFNNNLPIAIGADHAGFNYKAEIKNWLQTLNFIVEDVGTHSLESVDYPLFAHEVATKVLSNIAGFGILFCGSANGVAITANKHKNIRAGLCWTVEVASLVRQHNNANIICIPSRFITIEDAKNMITTFMQTPFEAGRHQLRVDKIEC